MTRISADFTGNRAGGLTVHGNVASHGWDALRFGPEHKVPPELDRVSNHGIFQALIDPCPRASGPIASGPQVTMPIVHDDIETETLGHRMPVLFLDSAYAS